MYIDLVVVSFRCGVLTALSYRPGGFLHMLQGLKCSLVGLHIKGRYEGWNFNSGNYLFTTDTK